MKTHRDLFANFLGAQAGEEVRRIFSPAALRAGLDLRMPADPGPADPAEPGALAALAHHARERLEPLREGFRKLHERIEADAPATEAVRSKAALESAPFVVGSQYLIHCVCGSWNNESRYAMAALRIHATDLGAGQPGASRIQRYQELLRRHGLADAAEELLHAGSDPRISDGAFSFAAGLLVLGYFPESLAGEILGANLYLRQCGLLPHLAFVAHGDPAACQFLDLARDPQGSALDLQEIAETAVREFLSDAAEPARASVRRGYFWAQTQAEAMGRALLDVLVRWVDPREAAQELISRRQLDASQYHAKVRLGRMPMQPLLHEGDSASFLEYLAASAYVRAGRPETSPLLTSLISPRGKMFRIFNRDDIAILHRWIKGLPYAEAAPHPAAHRLWTDDGALLTAIASAAGPAHRPSPEPQAHHAPRIGPRQAYPRLLHDELTPGEEAFAKQYAQQWLARAARSVARGHCPLPAQWEPGILRRWLLGQHETSNKALDQEQDQETPSRASVVADILSLAPLTMIDGAWLAGFSHPAVASSAHGSRLFETFFDELGNGIEVQNHPVIYRQLLQAVHGELPATADTGYAAAACFTDRDFDLPVFWLSIGRYPLTYGLEILGLNLAMELSGVGGGYRRTHKALVAYGYPTMFVDLHNSIDNISSGHTAWAAASLDTCLSTFPRSDRPAAWARVRTGFAALNLPKDPTMLERIREKARSWL